MSALVARPVALNALDCLLDPVVHGVAGLAGEAVALAVGRQALNGVREALHRLLVVGVPGVQALVGLGGLHEHLQAFVHW